MRISPDELCPCGSQLIAEQCCVPKSYPIADAESRWRDLKIEMHGVTASGRLVPVPDDLTAIYTVNQPHQIDPTVEVALASWSEVFSAKVKLLRQREALEQLRTPDTLLSNLDDGLHAVRYHQRQFLCRMFALDEKHSRHETRGSERLQVVFNDLPLRCELEAFLVRTSGSLDALGQLLGLIVTGKKRTYGELLKLLPNKREIDPILRSALTDIFAENNSWIEEAKNYRHAIVHRAEFEDFRGPLLGANGVKLAAIADRDAAVFVIGVWSDLIRMMKSVADTMTSHSERWKMP